jgi:hypothetical protein
MASRRRDRGRLFVLALILVTAVVVVVIVIALEPDRCHVDLLGAGQVLLAPSQRRRPLLTRLSLA